MKPSQGRVVVAFTYARSGFFDPKPADLATFFEEAQFGRQPIDHQQGRMLCRQVLTRTGWAVACQFKRFEVAQATEKTTHDPHFRYPGAGYRTGNRQH